MNTNSKIMNMMMIITMTIQIALELMGPVGSCLPSVRNVPIVLGVAMPAPLVATMRNSYVVSTTQHYAGHLQ